MKTIFMTGTSSGLGKAAVKLFAGRGWRVIATMRYPEKETELTQLDKVILLPLEVTNPGQIKDTVEKSIALGVDVVFNNAGFGLGGPLESYTDEQMVKQINTNLLGVIRVTQAFVPYFRVKKSGLFLTTTSIGGLITFPFYSVYCASKWGIEGFCESLSFELNQFGIGVKTISPGGINSSFRSSTDRAQNDAYRELFDKVTTAFINGETLTIASAPEQIAEVVYEAATDGKNQLRYQAGKDAIAYVTRRREVGAEVFRKELKELFFGKS
jgi:NAD(P)-dependent dehydrogenase (short-subunit alcohol dehydrogenase family)